MDEPIPDEWLRLHAHQRDLLVALSRGGPASGSALHSLTGGVDGREAPPTTYRNLSGLQDKGLVESEAKNGRENVYRNTADGVRLLIASPVSVDGGEA